VESAIDEKTGMLVAAEELWLLGSESAASFVCMGCGVRAFPASYRATNLVRPYFTVGVSGHGSGCWAAGAKQAGCGESRPYAAEETESLLSYPGVLSLEEGGPLIGEDLAQTLGDNPPQPLVPSGPRSPCPNRRCWTVGTIRQLCKTFVRFPEHRYLPLHVPGIAARQYWSVFKRVKWDALACYQDPRIWYCAIRWSRPVETAVSIEVALDAGERCAARLVRGHRVRIEWAGWNSAQQQHFRSELQDAQREAMHARKCQDYQTKAYLFFAGIQDCSDPALFHVADHRLVCCIATAISYPPRPRD